MPKIDLINREYPYFTVIERNTERKGKNVWWNCKCVCGKIFTATTTDINREVVKSCGCKRAQLIGEAHFQDLTGQIFGELKVLCRNYQLQKERNGSNTLYDCQCSCGNIITIERAKLTVRGQSSCGCKQSIGELHIHRILNENNIHYKSEYTCDELKTEKNGYLRFDFAILDENNKNIIRLIEFDGPQHNEKNNFFDDSLLQERDKIKNEYAKKKNIPLVRLPYSKRDNMTLNDLLSNTYLVI